MTEALDSVFEKLFEGNQHYEHVRLPSKVRRILKAHDGKGYILHAFLHKKSKDLGDRNDEIIMMLGYDKYDGMCVNRGPGLCCSMDGDPNHTWVSLAEDLAASCPYLAVRKRTKKN